MTIMYQNLVVNVGVLVFLCTIHNGFSEIRKTQYGLIEGEIVQSAYDLTYTFYSFKGVPYARPPIGNRRFQEPLAPESWTGIKKTIEPASACSQVGNFGFDSEAMGSEDCLYLEIFEPITARKNNTDLLPVMVWFHGGIFVLGSVNETGPDYLMEKPVVVVSVSYRLGVFGFLNTLDKNAQGNAGLKDQNFALLWVKENIEQFGGDPNRVTIFGASAGGASVLYHILSEKSSGLFHQAISQSGSTLNGWAYQGNPLEKAKRLAKSLGITANDTKTIVEELQKVDVNTLAVAAFNKSIVGSFLPYLSQPFGPSIETKSDSAFLSESTFKIMEANNFSKVPYMLGYNTEEGSFPYFYIESGIVDFKMYEDHPELLIPPAMNINLNSICAKSTIEDIKQFYFKDGNVTNKYNWIPYMSQETFVRGITKTIEFTYQQMPVYSYKFSYTENTRMSYIGGPGHYEEVQYLWYPRGGMGSLPVTPNDELTRKRLITMWTNFATTGNPTPVQDELLQNVTWPKVDENRYYLDIGINLDVAQYLNQADSKFWDELFQRCGNPPYYIY